MEISIKGILGILLVLVLVAAGISSGYTIDEGERGVILRNGKAVGTAEPGLGWKTPFITSVQTIDITTQKQQYNPFNAISGDQQKATMSVSISYHVPADKVLLVYQKYGSISNLQSAVIDRLTRGKLTVIFGQYTAESAVKQGEKLASDLQKAITSEIPNGVVVIDGVNIEGISYSDEYNQRIESRQAEEIEVTKRQKSLEKERIDKEITQTKADATAYEREALANADAAAIKAKGLAEAEAINAKGKALRDNPALVDLTYAEKWNGITPTTVVPNSSITGLNIK